MYEIINKPIPTRTSSYFLFIVCLLLFQTSIAYSVEIITSVDRDPVSLNESFQLIFTANDNPDGEPNFTPLQKDFDILNQSQSSSTSIINGQFSKTIQWKLNVMAKKAGTLVVPVIRFGDDRSTLLTLTVTQVPSDNRITTDDELFIEVEVDKEKPFVQSQVIYTVRIFSRVSVAQGDLSEPETADNLVEKLGEESKFTTQIHGVNYHVTEIKYAIFPQKSGTLTIPPIRLLAQVVEPGSSNFGGFFSRRITHTKRVESNAVSLDVQPIPKTFNGKHWLPSSGVVLTQEWSGDFSQMKVGEPLTRTLNILAKGTTVGMLPELNKSKTVPDFKNYPDQPILKEEKKQDGLYAFRQEKIAMIPKRKGEFILPAIQIPWYNTETGTMEFAEVPETTINVLSAPDAAVTKSPDTDQRETISEQTEQKVLVKKDVPSDKTLPVADSSNSTWMWLAILFGLGWLLTLIYLIVKTRAVHSESEVDPKELKLKECIKAVKRACQKNDPNATKDALLAWGKLQYNITSLGALAEHCEARLRNEIKILNQVLYGKQEESWNGKDLYRTFVENKAMSQIKSDQDEALEPLYRL